jgi:2-polyprenyl-6-methoxyphenol hydroxylase-like FAD-dependent oxidoreductase
MKVLIVGGGIGGIVTALMLHARGIACEVFEQAEEVRELGVGLTLLPHAVKELVSLGLLGALDEVSIRSEHLYYLTRKGQIVWNEPRGLLAGYDVPQFFAHRGKLQMLLYRALRQRLPDTALHLDRRLVEFSQDGDTVKAVFSDRSGTLHRAEGDLMIGADGIHSTVRSTLFPGQVTPRWSGLMLWRGATDWPDFLGGASVMIHGGVDTKFVCYPIAPGETPGTKLTNWAAIIRVAPDGSAPPSRENWSKVGKRSDLVPYLDRFKSDTIDFKGLVDATGTFWEYPMCDRDPIDNWTAGRVTLLGDAAHPMYPMGANGASQAILDARALTDALASSHGYDAALAAYQAERLPRTSAIVALNRKGGPEAVIDAVEALAPEGFVDIDAVMSRDQRQAFMSNYAQNAGYSKDQVARQ